MPTYDYQCGKCEHAYEVTCTIAEMEKKEKAAKCPECGSKKKSQVMSPVNFAFANPEGTDRWNNSTYGHGYRFQHTLPKVQAERSHAQDVSHMGADPYGAGPADFNLGEGVHDNEGPISLT